MSVSDFCNEISSSNLVRNLIQDLFSYNTIKRKRVLEYYFFHDAILTSPVMSTEGVNNIQYVYTIWQTLNRKEPTITNIVFDGKTAVVHLIHNLSPTILPSFIQLQIPAITTLSFRETECDSGLLKIYKQQDSWTLEGLLQSVPLVSYWYNNVLRVVMGKLLTTAGDIVDSSISYAQKMSAQGREIQHYGHELAIENMEKLEEYRSDLETHYLEGLKNWKQSPYLLSDTDDALSPIKETSQGGLSLIEGEIVLLEEEEDVDLQQ